MTRPACASASAPTCGSSRVHDEPRPRRQARRPRRASARRRARARRSGRAGRGRGCRGRPRAAARAAATSGSAASSTSNRPSSASPAARRVEATPETRFAPEWLCASRNRGRRISAAIAEVVVLPFVAETTAAPPGGALPAGRSRRGRASTRSLPGTVVPPPRPEARERRADAARSAISSASGGRRRIGRA